MASDNRLLGKFGLEGIPAAPRGMPQIEVTFDIDANGILNVSAKDKATSKEAQIRITASTGLSEKEIEKMVRDSEQFAEKDKQRKDIAEARNQADHTVYASEKAVRDFGDKVGADDKAKIEKAVEALKKAKEGEDAAAMKRAVEAVNQSLHGVSQQLYEAAAKAQQQGQGAGAGGPAPEAPREGGAKKGGDEKIIDADFKTK
jgi:molecular chaperone DnaK